MPDRFVHRGIAVLALAGALSLAGARPAAAAPRPGLFERGLRWLALLIHPQPAGSSAVSAFLAAALPPPSTDKGLGADPNGTFLPGGPINP